MHYLVTGTAGFIGNHVAERLLARGDSVVGLDNVNDYYDPQLKEDRLKRIHDHERFIEARISLQDRERVAEVFAGHEFDCVIHLAAQAGVRYSLTNPHAYVDSNLSGFMNILEGCRHHHIDHLVFASSSSVYGANTSMPFSVHHNVDHPVSLYAATKKSNELMAHSYSHIYGIPMTGLRFFTVYGPWGRPDMALFLFTRAILNGEPIEVYNHGHMQRDFTYIDDIVEGVIRTADRVPQPDPGWNSDQPDPATSYAPYRLYNIGNHTPVKLEDFITTLEEALGQKAERKYMDLQPGDVPATYADVDDLQRDVGFAPATPLATGIDRFVAWYRDYYQA